MENAKIINKELEKKYGKDVTGKPCYRIVQNSNLSEKRIGDFSFWHGNIYLRTEENICAEVPKYNYIPDGYWILERLYYTTNPELTSKFTYEPIWVFSDPKTGEYQTPILKACVFLIESSERGPTAVLSESEEMRKEVNTFYEMLGGDTSEADYIRGGSGTSMSGLDAPDLIKDKN